MGDTSNNEIQRCHPRATCYNSIGSYRCTCIQGFSGDGFDCSGNRFKFLIAILKVHRDFNSLFCFLFWSNSILNTWQIFVSFNGFGNNIDTFTVQSSGILLQLYSKYRRQPSGAEKFLKFYRKTSKRGLRHRGLSVTFCEIFRNEYLRNILWTIFSSLNTKVAII